jgi:hypothetical protein
MIKYVVPRECPGIRLKINKRLTLVNAKNISKYKGALKKRRIIVEFI